MDYSSVATEVPPEIEPMAARIDGPARWSLPARIGFRFSFIYLMLYSFFNGNVTVFSILQPFKEVNRWVHDQLFLPFGALTQIVGVRLFHFTGVTATWHGDGSGDTPLNYLLAFNFLVIAIAGTLVWSILDRRRPHYRTLYAWFRFLLRLNVGMGMLQYGFYKVYPIQMQPPNLAVLNEPVGNSSPMTLLWTLLALNPIYERICGLAEVIGGMLILIRPTALAGAVVSAFVMTNVVLYNFFFDVPVKLYAVHLLAMAFFLMLPDLKALWDFFARERPAQLTGEWVPPVSAAGIKVFEIAFFVLAIASYLKYDGDRYKAYTDSVHPSPLIGLWQLDPASPMPKTNGGAPWNQISIDNLTRGMARSTDGQLWRMILNCDEAKHTLGMNSRGGSDQGKYTWQTPSPDLLVLTGTGKTPITLTFHRIPTPSQYPLLTRGFHLVSEFGYER